MPFAWRSLWLAPLAPALLFSCAAFVITRTHQGFLWLLLFVAGAAIAYGCTLTLFLPTLWLLSRFTTVSAKVGCGIGTLLGAAVFFPIEWVQYNASGVDSGPPEGTYAAWLVGNWNPDLWIFASAGLVASAAYYALLPKPAATGAASASSLTT